MCSDTWDKPRGSMSSIPRHPKTPAQAAGGYQPSIFLSIDSLLRDSLSPTLLGCHNLAISLVEYRNGKHEKK